MSSTTLGVLLSIGAVGAIVGATIARRLIRVMPIGRAYSLALTGGFLAPVLVPAAAGPLPAVLAAFIVALFLYYLGIAIVNVIIVSLRQTITPHSVLGRMTAATRTLMWGLGSLGGLFGGLLGGAVGVHAALWVSAVASTILFVPILFSPVSRLRAMPAPAEQP